MSQDPIEPCKEPPLGGRRRLTISVLVAGAWLVAGFGFVPWLIRWAYAGRSFGWVNAILAGREQHPVEVYLQGWYAIAWKLTIMMVGVGVLIHNRRRIQVGFDRLVRAEPAVRTGELLMISLTWGLVAGLAEGAHIGVRKWVTPLSAATFDQSLDAVWMAPLAEAAVFVCLGLVAALPLRPWRRPVSYKLAVLSFAWLTFFGLLRSARLGLGVWAVALVSLGIAVQLSGWAVRRHLPLRRRGVRILAVLTGVVTACGLVRVSAQHLREYRAVAALPQADPDSPNVLILILDTVRAASLSLYGHGRETTPRLDEFAREGTVFDMAVSPTSWTLPAHASMFTGRWPTDLSTDWGVPLDTSWPTLAEVLSDRGYATAAFVANYYYAGRTSGVARGFGHYEDAPVSLGMFVTNGWWSRSLVNALRKEFDKHGNLTHKDAEEVAGSFLGWLSGRSASDRPFMAFLNFMDAHSPYFAPDSISRRFSREGAMYWQETGHTYDSLELSDLRSRYDAGIAYIDQQLGGVFDGLKARGLLDRTIVIVVGDHGEQLGEHHPRLMDHGNSLYFASIHVPLVIRYPEAVPAGLRVPEAVSTRRIPVTVLELIGGESPFPGAALSQEWTGKWDSEGSGESPSSTLSPSPSMSPHDPLAKGPMRSVVNGRWHYIRNGDGTEELYDVLADPWEVDDRSADPDHRGTMDRLRELVPQEMAPRVGDAGTLGSLKP